MKVKTVLARILITSTLILSLIACGSSESTVVCDIPGCTLTSQAALDGFVTNTSIAETNGFSNPPFTGDNDSTSQGLAARQFYSFDISSIPSTTTVTAATLRLFQAFVGGQPYTDLGNVIVDHINYGISLDASDYNAIAIAPNVGTLSTDGTLVYKQLDATSSVLNDIANGRTNSQYRIRFSPLDSNNDGLDDFVAFTDGEGSCCTLNIQPPQLVLTLN